MGKHEHNTGERVQFITREVLCPFPKQALRYFLLRLSSHCLERRHALRSAKLCLSTAYPLREIDNIVEMWVDS
jgi:hypothetical protein